MTPTQEPSIIQDAQSDLQEISSAAGAAEKRAAAEAVAAEVIAEQDRIAEAAGTGKPQKVGTQEPTAVYYKFVADLPPGKYTVPAVGKVSPGSIYKVRAIDEVVFKDFPNWEKSTAQALKAQNKE